MSHTLDPLLRDLVAWVALTRRPYNDVLSAWRTSCPRLPVWEEAVDRGYVVRRSVKGLGLCVLATDEGHRFLRKAMPVAP